MAPKNEKSLLFSNTVAPPADAPSLDVQSLDRRFQGLDIATNAPPKFRNTKYPESHLYPSSSSSRHGSTQQPAARGTSRTTEKGSSMRDDYPPPYKSHASPIKPSNLGDPRDRGYPSKVPTQRSPQRLDRESHMPSSSRNQPSYAASQRKPQQTAFADFPHVKTENYKLGNMQRTYLESMVPASQYNKNASYTPTTAGGSRAPAGARSILVDPGDVVMAQRQTQYPSMTPVEQAKQETWAQSMIERTGSCPEGFEWKRIRDGYQCTGGYHVICDELLAEGKGGLWLLRSPHVPDMRWGPFYAKGESKIFHYAGPEPMPFGCQRTTGGNGSAALRPNLASAILASRLQRGPLGSRFPHGSNFYRSGR